MKKYTKEIDVTLLLITGACLFGSYIPGLQGLSQWCTPPMLLFLGLARKCLTLTMFFIGAYLSADVLRAVGLKPLIQGVLLWTVISLASLLYILA